MPLTITFVQTLLHKPIELELNNNCQRPYFSLTKYKVPSLKLSIIQNKAQKRHHPSLKYFVRSYNMIFFIRYLTALLLDDQIKWWRMWNQQ